MLTEDYVSFETAKLLKEKGFDEICEYIYGIPNVGKDHVLKRFYKPIKNSELIDDAYTAPTLQMAMKWLWETHRLHVSPCMTIKKSGFTFLNQWHCIVAWVDKDNQYDLKCIGEGYSSYQEACEAGIKYCLEKKLTLI